MLKKITLFFTLFLLVFTIQAQPIGYPVGEVYDIKKKEIAKGNGFVEIIELNLDVETNHSIKAIVHYDEDIDVFSQYFFEDKEKNQRDNIILLIRISWSMEVANEVISNLNNMDLEYQHQWYWYNHFHTAPAFDYYTTIVYDADVEDNRFVVTIRPVD